VLGYLFIAAAIIVFLMIALSMFDDRVMPWACPSCFEGSDEDALGQRRTWYLAHRDGRVRCRWCRERFKEHPNGSLVRDHDG